MCFKRRKPNLDAEWISREDFLVCLGKYGIKPISKEDPLDSKINLVTIGELDRIAPKLVYPADWYAGELFDCEDYALQASLDAKRKYGVTLVLCLGMMPEGYHGFLLALDKLGKVWVMENNSGWPWAGVWYEPAKDKNSVSEGHYFPQKVFA